VPLFGNNALTTTVVTSKDGIRVLHQGCLSQRKKRIVFPCELDVTVQSYRFPFLSLFPSLTDRKSDE
jgi:hypothetical protein